MLRKISIIIIVLLLSMPCLNGCEKRSDKTQTDQEPVKTEAEYAAEAKEQINKDNMDQELERLEKSVEQDISEEP